jgi:RNA polymerase sigma-70 factor, ECF subfamily
MLCSVRQSEKRNKATPLHSKPSTICIERMYSLCLRMLHDPTDAEDALQDAFLQLFRKIQTFRGESAFSSWLHRLAVNVVLMRMRRKKPVSVTVEETPNHDDETTAPVYEIGEPDLHLAGLADRLALQAAVNQLPKGYKRMFILHDVQGYQHSEIAQTRGLSIGNSKSQLHKARKRLRGLLRPPQLLPRNRNHPLSGYSFTLRAS